jgi:hypothetical protein
MKAGMTVAVKKVNGPLAAGRSVRTRIVTQLLAYAQKHCNEFGLEARNF